ncbi:MAG: hypothetical protein JRI86_00260 [Deltaproteobacteria bacterium]|nr:hypothetical protein [Deltaproteobacteria bacterium]
MKGMNFFYGIFKAKVATWPLSVLSERFFYKFKAEWKGAHEKPFTDLQIKVSDSIDGSQCLVLARV